MEWIILIGITLFSAYAGYRKGALKTVLRFIGFLAGYVVAWQFTPELAQFLINSHKLQGIVVYPIAGLSLFFGTGIVLNIIFALTLWMLPKHWVESGRPIGAALGGMLGLVLGFLCVWTIGIVQNAFIQRMNAANPNATAPTHQTSLVGKITGDVIRSATEVMLDDNNPGGALAGQMLSDPIAITQGINYLNKETAFRELFADGNNYRTMVNGTPEDIAQLPAFQSIVNDPKAMEFLAQSGLSGKTPDAQKTVLAETFSKYAKNIEKIKNTPEFREAIADPAIAQAVQNQNYAPLLTNEKVRLLAEMLMHGTVTPAQGAAASNTKGAATNGSPGATQLSGDALSLPLASQTIYQWTDLRGGVHFTSQEPNPADVKGEVKKISQ